MIETPQAGAGTICLRGYVPAAEIKDPREIVLEQGLYLFDDIGLGLMIFGKPIGDYVPVGFQGLHEGRA